MLISSLPGNDPEQVMMIAVSDDSKVFELSLQLVSNEVLQVLKLR